MEDSAIIRLYWNRDQRAVAETDLKYHPYCYTVSHNILTDHEDAEECVNDTWFRAWNAMPPQQPQVLRAFLGKITRNLSLDRYRSGKTEKRGGELERIELELADCATQSDIDEHLNVTETAKLITQFLDSCDQTSRVLFLRRYWYADSIAAIAKRFSMPESTVKSNLHRTRIKLRGYLEAEGVTVG
jgi:RNA polymerase sigma-70 factor (ECF subfamily)